MFFTDAIEYYAVIFGFSNKVPARWEKFDLKQCLEAYKYFLSPAQTEEFNRLAFEKLLSLAKTVYECLIVCDATPDSNHKKAALDKAIETAQDYKLCLDIYDKTISGIIDADSTNEINNKTIKKIVDMAQTFELCLKVYDRVDCFKQYKDIEKATLEKMAGLAQTFGQYIKTCKNAFWSGSEDIEKAMLEKAASLAQTYEQIFEVYECAPSDSEIEKTMLEKILSLAQTYEQCRKAYDMASVNSELGRAMLEKMTSLAQTSEQHIETLVAQRLEVAENKRPGVCIRLL